MKAFWSQCDKKLRVLGNLYVAKQAADGDTEGVNAKISMVKFQLLAMRKPEKQLQVLKAKRKKVADKREELK